MRCLIGLCVTIGTVLVGYWVWYSRPQQRFFRALAAIERRDFRKAEVELSRFRAEEDCEKYFDFLMGAMLLRHDRHEAAIRYFSRTQPEGKMREVVLLWTGECLYRMGRLVEAQWALSQMTEEFPKNYLGHRWLGIVYYDLGMTNAAASELRRALELNPADFRPHALLAVLHYDVGQYAAAVSHYRALSAERPNSDASSNMAIALIQLHEYREALDVLEALPAGVDELILQAECHLEMGAPDRAAEMLEKARAIGPKSRPVLIFTAQRLLDANKPAEAAPLLKQAVDQDPHDFRSRYKLAMTYRDLGALDDYSREMSRSEESRKLHDRDSELTQKLRKQPNDAEIRYELSVVAGELGFGEIAALWRRGADAFRPLP